MVVERQWFWPAEARIAVCRVFVLAMLLGNVAVENNSHGKMVCAKLLDQFCVKLRQNFCVGTGHAGRHMDVTDCEYRQFGETGWTASALGHQ